MQVCPFNLKSCFLCLGVFLEDYELSTKKLIELWVVGRSLRFGVARILEEVEECLEELIQRVLVQIVQRNSIGGIKSCRIHDVDLPISKAKEERFFGIHMGTFSLFMLDDLDSRLSLASYTGGMNRCRFSIEGLGHKSKTPSKSFRRGMKKGSQGLSHLVDHFASGFLVLCFRKISRSRRRRYLILKINSFI
ncbi:disease resistance RPP8-like protein 3 [Magnolia sinica]|uniref:disease resistance RPP8-like protein 3 n=1 Tax=Magnolia sinica TaxID=86752 RepID=UPI00265835CC|nr:disease resistance RPP8-like protein 3 [Magnolia sinica]